MSGDWRPVKADPILGCTVSFSVLCVCIWYLCLHVHAVLCQEDRKGSPWSYLRTKHNRSFRSYRAHQWHDCSCVQMMRAAQGIYTYACTMVYFKEKCAQAFHTGFVPTTKSSLSIFFWQHEIKVGGVILLSNEASPIVNSALTAQLLAAFEIEKLLRRRQPAPRLPPKPEDYLGMYSSSQKITPTTSQVSQTEQLYRGVMWKSRARWSQRGSPAKTWLFSLPLSQRVRKENLCKSGGLPA